MAEERRRAELLAAGLVEIYGGNLTAVVLYGSAARGEYRSGVSDLNVLVILAELDLAHLRRAAGLTSDWVAEGNPPPLMLSEREWRGSADVFPLEYSDIRDANVLLAGSDPFAGIRIRREHLRLQLEHELRSKKIQLREGYLVAGTPSEMGSLLTRSVSTFLALFRGMLRLAGKPVPRSAPDLVAAAAAEAGFEPKAVLEALRAKVGGGSFEVPPAGPISAGYLQAVERSVLWLDRYEKQLESEDEI